MNDSQKKKIITQDSSSSFTSKFLIKSSHFIKIDECLFVSNTKFFFWHFFLILSTIKQAVLNDGVSIISYGSLQSVNLSKIMLIFSSWQAAISEKCDSCACSATKIDVIIFPKIAIFFMSTFNPGGSVGHGWQRRGKITLKKKAIKTPLNDKLLNFALLASLIMLHA